MSANPNQTPRGGGGGGELPMTMTTTTTTTSKKEDERNPAPRMTSSSSSARPSIEQNQNRHQYRHRSSSRHHHHHHHHAHRDQHRMMSGIGLIKLLLRHRVFRWRQRNYFLLHMLFIVFASLWGGFLLFVIESVFGTSVLPLIDALFSATSSVCVTGLTSFEFSQFALASQMLVLFLIFIGGFTISTIPALIIKLILAHKRMMRKRRAISRSDSLSTSSGRPSLQINRPSLQIDSRTSFQSNRPSLQINRPSLQIERPSLQIDGRTSFQNNRSSLLPKHSNSTVAPSGTIASIMQSNRTIYPIRKKIDFERPNDFQQPYQREIIQQVLRYRPPPASDIEFLAISALLVISIGIIVLIMLVSFLIFAVYLSVYYHGQAGKLNNVHPLWLSLFFTVSGFNNAGLIPLPDNLVMFANDLLINLLVSFLIISGNTFFPLILRSVISILFRLSKRYKLVFKYLLDNHHHISVHLFPRLQTQVYVSISVFLLILGSVVTTIMEHDNPSLAQYPWWGRLLIFVFQSVSTRAAGFNTANLNTFHTVTLIVYILMMRTKVQMCCALDEEAYNIAAVVNKLADKENKAKTKRSNSVVRPQSAPQSPRPQSPHVAAHIEMGNVAEEQAVSIFSAGGASRFSTSGDTGSNRPSLIDLFSSMNPASDTTVQQQGQQQQQQQQQQEEEEEAKNDIATAIPSDIATAIPSDIATSADLGMQPEATLQQPPPSVHPIATDNPLNIGDDEEAERTVPCVTLNMDVSNADQNGQQPDEQPVVVPLNDVDNNDNDNDNITMEGSDNDPEFEVNVKAIVHELLDYNIPTPTDDSRVELEQVQQRPWHIRLAHGLVSGLWAVFGKGGSVVKKILSHLHNLLVRNNSWLMVIIFLICAIENVQLMSDPTQFSFLRVVFEVISAFGNVGHSISHPASPNTSFSGVLSPASKLLIILTLIIGRHRGMLGSMKDQESTEKDVKSVMEEHELQQAQRQFREKSSRFFRRRPQKQKNASTTASPTTPAASTFSSQTAPAQGVT